ncbi:MarR family transcriptional regulator [Mesorhizobium sp. M4B.F.Ca.ET.049.02.1.2]|uniref:MarR family winged helix-turn-helix transcriptional regulator n=1 Tax=unclassified Mesorhizobium TaxID=325217 RepID=UPI0032AEE1CF
MPAARDHLNPLLSESGLNVGEFDVLTPLRRSGEPYRLSPTQLYESAMISSGGMTNRLDRLECAGLVERRPDPKDRRGKQIALTTGGKRAIDDLIGPMVAARRAIDLRADAVGAGDSQRPAQEIAHWPLGTLSSPPVTSPGVNGS